MYSVLNFVISLLPVVSSVGLGDHDVVLRVLIAAVMLARTCGGSEK